MTIEGNRGFLLDIITVESCVRYHISNEDGMCFMCLYSNNTVKLSVTIISSARLLLEYETGPSHESVLKQTSDKTGKNSDCSLIKCLN